MTIVFNEEQLALRDAVRKFVGDHFSSERNRATVDFADGHDVTAWKLMAQQLGLQGLTIPDELGGSDASVIELAIALEEMGRAVTCSPFLSTVLATEVLRACGDDEVLGDLLPGIAEGTTIATLALSVGEGSGRGLTATTNSGGTQLDGVLNFVPDGQIADLVLVPASEVGGNSLFAVETSTAVTRTPLVTLDHTRKQAQLSFDTAVGRRITPEHGEGSERLARALDVVRTLIAAEQLGGAQQCLTMSVEYAKTRSQFGRRIGSFQAVKHRCADMLVAVESARSAVLYAVEAAAQGSDALRLAAPLALTTVTDAYQYCARQNIQLHGGIGCTWEHDAHLHYRRAHAATALIGDGRHHRALLATRLGM